MRYIQSFENATAIQTAVDNGSLGKPYVAYDKAEEKIDWDSKKADYSKMYLTAKFLEYGTFKVNNSNVSYSINNGEWETTTAATTLNVSNGDSIRFKGTNGGKFLFSGNTIAFETIGNIMSLFYSDNFIGQTSLNKKTCNSMFRECTNLTGADNLILPATTLVGSCYNCMFGACTRLETAPELPATTLASSCYQDMFSGCTSLTTAPELPATTLVSKCYYDMFWNCTSLTQAPTLPATTLASDCYRYMFQGCSSLTTAPALPATTLAESCYNGMFWNCTSLTQAPTLPATTLASSCYNNMFRECTSLTKAPELPATTLANYCYTDMFRGCTSLTTAPELPATTLTSGCYERMLLDCISLNYIKCLATDLSASSCLSFWAYKVSSTGTFVKSAGVEWPTGRNGIPDGWTVEEVE